MSAVWTDGDLAFMRDHVDDFLPDECDLLRRQMVDDDSGNVVESWVVYAARVPCRVGPLSGSERMLAERIELVNAAMITVQWSENVRETDHVRIGADEYEVNVSSAPQSFQVQVRLICTKI